MSKDWLDSVVLITSSDPAIHDFGTGFAIYSEGQITYILTCAHVVEAVGGSATVKVNDIQATVVALGSESGIDLAVLGVMGLDKTPLPLGITGEKGESFTVAGFQSFNNKKELLFRPLNGILGEQVQVGVALAKFVKAWDLKITDDYQLQPGNSGSPVVDAANNTVAGVVRTRQGDGQKGLAISIEAVPSIWKGMPADIFLRTIQREAYLEAEEIELISFQQSGYPKARIFVSTLSDVSTEQKRLVNVVRELNQSHQLRLTLKVKDWSAHIEAVVGFPLQDILHHFQIERWDIFVGVLWHRFIPPSGGSDLETGRVFKGGTQEEFDLAYQLWKRKGLPQILIYRCDRNLPQGQFDIDQYHRVDSFCKGFARQAPGLMKGYKRFDEFERFVYRDLDLLLKGSSQPDISSTRGLSGRSDLSTGLGYRPQPSERLSRWEHQDLSSLPRPKPSELRSVSSLGEPIEDPQVRFPLSPEVSDRVKKRLRPERPPGKLFGRQELLEEARWYVLNGKLPLLVYGIPGIGKTAFLATLFSDPEMKKIYNGENVLWINLRESGVSSLTEIVDEIAKGLSYLDVLYEKPGPAKLRRLKVALSHGLHVPGIVFDNVDLEAHQEALFNFQKEITTHVVVGSRTRFALPGTREIHLRELAPNYAIDAFKSYARSTTDDDERIEAICELIGYHPQAIKIAASAMYDNRLSLEELARQLKNKRRELISLGSEDDFKFNMLVSFGVSYDNLSSPSEKRVFNVLGALAPSGASLAAIAAGSKFHEFECETLLGQLQKRSLVERDERDPDYYRMHQLLHDFAQEILKDMRS